MTKSPTSGMTIEQRILHVGGRNNAAGYVEFGSVQAVQALVQQVLRDLPDQAVQPKRAQLPQAAPGVQGGDAVCCNADCTWGGKLTDCVVCGQVGPLCPECREVVEPCGATSQQSAQPVAGQYTLIHQVKIWGTWHHCTLEGWGAAPECDRRVLYGYLAAQPVDARRIPEGLDIGETSEGEVFVSSPVEGPGFMHPHGKKGPLSERLLHHLAIALMDENAEAPKQ